MRLLLLTVLPATISPFGQALADDQLSVDHNAPLLASDLDFEKWTITGKVDSKAVLSVVHVLRFSGDNRQVRAVETAKYTTETRSVSASLVVGNPTLFHQAKTVAVRTPSGSVNTYDVRQVDQPAESTVVKNTKFKANGKLQFVGSFVYSSGGSETLRILLFARIGKLSEYPKLEAAVGQAKAAVGPKESVTIQQVNQLESLPPAVVKRLP